MGGGKLYEKIASHLKDAIARGELKVGEAIYSEPEMCKKFNVSRTSVRKAIRELAAQNILVSRQGMGTFVKGDGHGLIHNTVCLVNHWTRRLRYDASETYYMDMVFGAEKAASDKGVGFQMFTGVIHSADDLLKQMGGKELDGIILDSAYQTHERDINIFKKISPHIVVLDGNPAETNLPCAAPDDVSGFESVLELVPESGTVCYLHETMTVHGRRGLATFKKALKKRPVKNIMFADYAAGLGAETFFYVNHYPLICKALEPVFAEGRMADTIITRSDHAGLRAIQFLRLKNLAVPLDVSVFGFGGMNFSSMTDPPLTTVRVDSSAMAQKAFDFLLELIEGKTEDKIRLQPVSLVQRESHNPKI
jgi:DNA-binding LacI/PurR family transcriptional regulator